MQKYGARPTQLINRIDEVHGAESNMTSANSSRHHENHEWPFSRTLRLDCSCGVI
jgi:hypothetical protein